jgi:membrane-associated phospholipid phosphatase
MSVEIAIAVSIFLRHRKAAVLALAMEVVLALSPVVVGTHYPSDVLGGAALGTLAALFFWWPPVRRPLHELADWAIAGVRTPPAAALRPLSREAAGLRE